MMRSLAPDLEKLRDRLGRPPLGEVVSAIDHLSYSVSAGSGAALVEEMQHRTGFRLASVHGDGRRDRRLALVGGVTDLLIGERTGIVQPVMDRLALATSDLEAAQRQLDELGVGRRLHPAGLLCDPLPGLGLQLLFVSKTGWEWLGPEVEEAFPEPPAALPAGRIGVIDHVALRLAGPDVLAGAEALVRLTGYAYSECYPVPDEKAETIVFRSRAEMPALVISWGESKSVVNQYVERYGPRVHHTAFYTENVTAVAREQRRRGIPFTSEQVIGSEERGILQLFTHPSPFSLEITEYVERFHGFQGFFDPGNVGKLMASTRQFNS
jgi:4-hydroxyphenylpyruvate dioxygenase-like putative hemolysin